MCQLVCLILFNFVFNSFAKQSKQDEWTERREGGDLQSQMHPCRPNHHANPSSYTPYAGANHSDCCIPFFLRRIRLLPLDRTPDPVPQFFICLLNDPPPRSFHSPRQLGSYPQRTVFGATSLVDCCIGRGRLVVRSRPRPPPLSPLFKHKKVHLPLPDPSDHAHGGPPTPPYIRRNNIPVGGRGGAG